MTQIEDETPVNQRLAESYDELPYPSFPYAATHPDRLLTAAALLGMDPPPGPVESCRVLEIGAGFGGNLIPLAFEFPGGEFLGIDLSAVQIAEGQRAIDELGLKNVRLETRDLMTLGPEIGQFDFIVAHGVYSWVPAPVQREILAICRRHLKPNGIAFISYNVNPGWKLRGMVRDMMIYHTAPLTDMRQRAQEAVSMLEFLSDAVADEDKLYAELIRHEREALKMAKTVDAYVAHEFLEDHNTPLYFHQFVDAAAEHHLRYLGEADLPEMHADKFPKSAQQALAHLAGDPIRREQYLDFIKRRLFRQTLLVHDDVRTDSQARAERLPGLYFCARLDCSNPNADPNAAEMMEFQHGKSITMRIGHPLTKAALMHLGEIWPRSILFEDLLVAARKRLANSPVVIQSPMDFAQDVQTVARHLLQTFVSRAVEVHALPNRFVAEAGPQPKGSPWALWQLKQGGMGTQGHKGPVITSRRHEGVELNDLTARVFGMLDGTRDRAQLQERLSEEVLHHGLVVQEEGQPVRNSEQLRRAVGQALELSLKSLAHAALLVQ